MKKTLFTALILLSTFGLSQTCSFGVESENTGNGGNISTGGLYEYYSATDFDVPLGTIFTLNQVKFNAIKGSADVEYVKISFLEEVGGMPGQTLHSFPELIPVEQTFLGELDIEGMDLYEITVDIPTSIEFPKGKYFMSVQAASGDDYMVAWEIAGEYTSTLGRFDIGKFDSEPWFTGFSYYDQVFEIIGECVDSGEEQPEFGEACTQGNEGNNYETALTFVSNSGFIHLADDFIVAENTTFYLTDFKIATLQLGNMKNADIKIRKSENDQPGGVIYQINNKGPKTENFFGYWPLEGYPLDVVAVDLQFELDEPIELVAGKYFLEIKANPVLFTEVLTWEATTEPGIGGYAFMANGGVEWQEAVGFNLVFDVNGFCEESLDVNEVEKSDFNYYPNPVNQELNFQSVSKVKSVEIFSMSGQLVQTSTPVSHKISTLNLSKGVYLVKAELENGQVETFKLLKN